MTHALERTAGDDAAVIAELEKMLEVRPVPAAITLSAPGQGVVEALVSVTGTVDDVQDLIVPGAYEETLRERNPKGCINHDVKKWVAHVEKAEEWPPGDPRLPKTTGDGKPWPKNAGALWMRLIYNLDDDEGRNAYAKVRFFAKFGECYWSIGYRVYPGGFKVIDGIRYIYKLDLVEVSPVIFGAHPYAHTLSVKTAFGPAESLPSLPGMPDGTCEDVIWELGKAGLLPAMEVKSGVGPALAKSAAEAVSIANLGDLQAAVAGIGKVPADEQADRRRVLMRRAIELGHPEAVPKAWRRSPKKTGAKAFVAGRPRLLMFDAKTHLAALDLDAVAALGGEPSGSIADLVDARLDELAAAAAGKAGVPGVADTASDKRSTRNLVRSYERGKLAARIRWGEDGDFGRCVAIAGKHMDEAKAKGFCANRHHGALGVWPGREKPGKGNAGKKTLIMTIRSKGAPVDESPTLTNPAAHTTTGDDPLEAKSYPRLAGTLEEQSDRVRSALRTFFAVRFADKAPQQAEQSGAALSWRPWVTVYGTFEDRVVCSVNLPDGSWDDDGPVFQLRYSYGGDGNVLLDEDSLEQVELEVDVVGDDGQAVDWDAATDGPLGDTVPVIDAMKQAYDLTATLRFASPADEAKDGVEVKAGRVLSAANAAALREMYEQMGNLLARAGVEGVGTPVEKKADDAPVETQQDAQEGSGQQEPDADHAVSDNQAQADADPAAGSAAVETKDSPALVDIDPGMLARWEKLTGRKAGVS